MRILSLLMCAVLLSVPAEAFAQSEVAAPFETLKALGGPWEGPVTTNPEEAEMEGKIVRVSMRVTSMGNALMHEMRTEGLPDDPITMFYLEDGRLLLTHYCDAGNRPRMVGRASPDGKTVTFDFLDVVGPLEYGHMHSVVFTMIDADHHTEEWTWMLPGDRPLRARFDLTRTN